MRAGFFAARSGEEIRYILPVASCSPKSSPPTGLRGPPRSLCGGLCEYAQSGRRCGRYRSASLPGVVGRGSGSGANPSRCLRDRSTTRGSGRLYQSLTAGTPLATGIGRRRPSLPVAGAYTSNRKGRFAPAPTPANAFWGPPPQNAGVGEYARFPIPAVIPPVGSRPMRAGRTGREYATRLRPPPSGRGTGHFRRKHAR